MEYRERERQRKRETTRQASETQQEKWRLEARASDKKKTKWTNFVGGATFTFCSSGEKIRNASSQQGEKRAALEKKQKGIQATKFFCE